MSETIHAIVLRVMRYSDKNSIVHVYSREHGRMSLLLPQGGSKRLVMRNALFQPLSTIEFVSKSAPSSDLHSVHEPRLTTNLAALYSHPHKSCIAMFLSEFLWRSLQEYEANEALFEFLTASISLLGDMDSGIANFHLWFLYQLGSFMGVQPDVESYHPGYWFDLGGGSFCKYSPASGNVLTPQEAEALMTLSRMTSQNLHLFRFSREQRNAILDSMLLYYRIHYSTLGSLRSHEVLKQLFD